MLDKFYRLIWLILYLISIIYDVLKWLSEKLNAAKLWSYEFCRSHGRIQKYELDYLQRCKKDLTKLPKHLNIIFGPGISKNIPEILLRLFTFAEIMDIEMISVYDVNCITSGNLKLVNLPQLKEIEEYHYQWAGKCENCGTNSNGIKGTKNYPNGVTKHITNGYTKGGRVEEIKKIHSCDVSFISLSNKIYQILPLDGRPLIAEICRNLFQMRHGKDMQSLLKDRTRLTERIDKDLKRKLFNGTQNDPDLCIIFNQYTCTYGMLPWQTRFTEFHTHPPHQYFNAEAFSNILYLFARCEQRWGK